NGVIPATLKSITPSVIVTVTLPSAEVKLTISLQQISVKPLPELNLKQQFPCVCQSAVLQGSSPVKIQTEPSAPTNVAPGCAALKHATAQFGILYISDVKLL